MMRADVAAWRSGFGWADLSVAPRRQPASDARTKLEPPAAPGAALSVEAPRTPGGDPVHPFVSRAALAAVLAAGNARRLVTEAERDGVRTGP